MQNTGFMQNFYNWLLASISTIQDIPPAPVAPAAQASQIDPADQEDVENIVCTVCALGDNEADLLLCDGCDNAMHASCIGLHGIPEGDWLCRRCVRAGKTVQVQKTQPTAQTPVVVYLRVSSQGQDQPEFGRVGMMTQMHAIMAYCQQIGLLILETFSEVGSGRNVKVLTQHAKMIKKLQVRSREGTCVLGYSASRFARNVEQAREMIAYLHSNNCYVYSVTEGVSSRDPAFMALLVQAQALSDQLSQTMRDSIARRRAQGQMIGTAPYGFERVDGRVRIKASERAGLELLIRNIDKSNKVVLEMLDRNNISARNGVWTSSKISCIRARLADPEFARLFQ